MKKKLFTLCLIAFSAILGSAEAAPEFKQEIVALLKPKLIHDGFSIVSAEVASILSKLSVLTRHSNR